MNRTPATSMKQAVMKQEAFIARHAAEWTEFEAWLVARGDSPREARLKQAQWQGLRDEDVPARYRRLCQQLSLARSRGYSPQVVERLQALSPARPRGVLPRTAAAVAYALEFFLADFPRLVRAQRGCLLAALLLFVVPLVGSFVAVQISPELIYSVYEPGAVAGMEEMYDPADPQRKLGRESGDDLAMFGFYVMNNVSIALRTFASGLIAGVGTIFVLVMNGLMIGGVAGHLQGVGHGDPFWRFVAGHSAPELTAIVLASTPACGSDWIWSRPGDDGVDALIEGGKVGAKLCLGIFAMLVFAAFVEAFWSSIGWIPAMVKFTVGGVLWTLTLLWLGLGGRSGSANAAPPRDPLSARPRMAGPGDPEPAASRQGRQRDASQ